MGAIPISILSCGLCRSGMNYHLHNPRVSTCFVSNIVSGFMSPANKTQPCPQRAYISVDNKHDRRHINFLKSCIFEMNVMKKIKIKQQNKIQEQQWGKASVGTWKEEKELVVGREGKGAVSQGVLHIQRLELCEEDGRWCLMMGLICTSLTIRGVDHLFMWLGPSVCLLWRKVGSSPLPLLDRPDFFLLLSFMDSDPGVENHERRDEKRKNNGRFEEGTKTNWINVSRNSHCPVRLKNRRR